MPHTSYTLRRYIIVGAIGFLVDASLLTMIVDVTGWWPWQARIPSFLAAVLVTWILNRQYVFPGRGPERTSVEAALYALIQAGGAACNFALFSLLVWWLPVLEKTLVLPLAGGAVAGLAFNFVASNGFLYARTRIGERA